MKSRKELNMENASKALIIAGAILLSILIISLGLMVYNQAKETVGSVNLTQQEIEAFNSKFTSYEGENVSGSKVNALIQTVIASNEQAIRDNTRAYICMSFPCEGGNDNGDDGMTFGVVDSKGCVYYLNSYVGSGNDGKAEDVFELWENGESGKPDDFEDMEKDSSNVGRLKVTSEENYTVSFYYHNGRVASILVK